LNPQTLLKNDNEQAISTKPLALSRIMNLSNTTDTTVSHPQRKQSPSARFAVN
jgi:hypothetical protein